MTPPLLAPGGPALASYSFITQGCCTCAHSGRGTYCTWHHFTCYLTNVLGRKCGAVVTDRDTGVKMPELESWLYHFLAK